MENDRENWFKSTDSMEWIKKHPLPRPNKMLMNCCRFHLWVKLYDFIIEGKQAKCYCSYIILDLWNLSQHTPIHTDTYSSLFPLARIKLKLEVANYRAWENCVMCWPHRKFHRAMIQLLYKHPAIQCSNQKFGFPLMIQEESRRDVGSIEAA